jgi:hypothetical protein
LWIVDLLSDPLDLVDHIHYSREVVADLERHSNLLSAGILLTIMSFFLVHRGCVQTGKQGTYGEEQ